MSFALASVSIRADALQHRVRRLAGHADYRTGRATAVSRRGQFIAIDETRSDDDHASRARAERVGDLDLDAVAPAHAPTALGASDRGTPEDQCDLSAEARVRRNAVVVVAAALDPVPDRHETAGDLATIRRVRREVRLRFQAVAAGIPRAASDHRRRRTQGERLAETMLTERPLQSGLLEPEVHVLLRDLHAARAWHAPFHERAGQHDDVLVEAAGVRIDFLDRVENRRTRILLAFPGLGGQARRKDERKSERDAGETPDGRIEMGHDDSLRAVRLVFLRASPRIGRAIRVHGDEGRTRMTRFSVGRNWADAGPGSLAHATAKLTTADVSGSSQNR